MSTPPDIIVIGSGPNGLTAAIELQKAGHQVLLVEGKDTVGGGTRTTQLIEEGTWHDVCSAVHPIAQLSPVFQSYPLGQFGLEWIYPIVNAAHPLDGGKGSAHYTSIDQTADTLLEDKETYRRFFGLISQYVDNIYPDLLGPLGIPSNIPDFIRFGLRAISSARWVSGFFKTQEAKALWGGMAAHSILPLENLTTAAIGLVLTSAGHLKGWPIAKSGSQAIADALAAYFISLGGTIQTGFWVNSLRDLPKAKAYVFDLTPKQIVEIAGESIGGIVKTQLQNYRYGMGVYKIDWILDAPVPFEYEPARQAGTVHIGGTFEEIALSERNAHKGIHSKKPFVLLSQPTLIDPSRSKNGNQVLWGYCHTPHGSTQDMTQVIENQIERFAPGFKKTILQRKTTNSVELQAYNPNYIGGDIAGGIIDLRQLYTRPIVSFDPYKLSNNGIFVCSSSTPPGGGVHGMGGFHAAKSVKKWLKKRK